MEAELFVVWQPSRPVSLSLAGLTFWPNWLERWLATLSVLSTQVRDPSGLLVPGRHSDIDSCSGAFKCLNNLQSCWHRQTGYGFTSFIYCGRLGKTDKPRGSLNAGAKYWCRFSAVYIDKRPIICFYRILRCDRIAPQFKSLSNILLFEIDWCIVYCIFVQNSNRYFLAHTFCIK